jgi:hypothetical protein
MADFLQRGRLDAENFRFPALSVAFFLTGIFFVNSVFAEKVANKITNCYTVSEVDKSSELPNYDYKKLNECLNQYSLTDVRIALILAYENFATEQKSNVFCEIAKSQYMPAQQECGMRLLWEEKMPQAQEMLANAAENASEVAKMALSEFEYSALTVENQKKTNQRMCMHPMLFIYDLRAVYATPYRKKFLQMMKDKRSKQFINALNFDLCYTSTKDKQYTKDDLLQDQLTLTKRAKAFLEKYPEFQEFNEHLIEHAR